MSFDKSRSNRSNSKDPAYANKASRRREGTDAELIESLHRLDGRNYGSYKSVIGDWEYGPFSIAIDRVQADPYAPPSNCRATSTPESMGIPPELLATVDGRVAVADFLNRAFDSNMARFSHPGTVAITRPGQEILVRSAATVTDEQIEIRFQVQLPARGRTIMGHTAAAIFDRDVPDIIMESLDFTPPEAAEHLERLRAHVATYEDYQALQSALQERSLVGFVADGAVLPRRSGISELPMGEAVAFETPESLRETIDLPNAGAVSGMALRPGITVIVGGGYHGKSTLLSAIQRGVYAHIPGDGRELVATARTAMKVRAADGRSVTGVDVSPFIAHLPQGADTTSFSTENASGSTSQAASIMEAAELGSELLLLDEDTSATNLLIRDSRMRELVHAEKEPITPLVDRIGALAKDRGISTIMVMGGSGDYLDVADHVLMLDTYRCFDVTEQAAAVVGAQPRERMDEPAFPETSPRVIKPIQRKGDRPKTKVYGTETIQLDKQRIDVSDLEQIVEVGQNEAIAWALRGMLERFANDDDASLATLASKIGSRLESEGLDELTKYGARQWPAHVSMPRPIDVGAALNRYRGLNLV
ncbi:ABC-ATPase domain-containing protein [Ancrocorticia populi]|uniref:Isopentenyl-diphosphate delta-isomerase n=1 Tax=Ancrocorticia populi TaxID=2175228 RepID=A0A2V1KCZ4_9ACTO|nr:ABC-ATPase domain-containing protein [Ancrocorticia populi]PWF27541.1 isopentenyl-diphosphate delta-isomerase [Ancrocorticia populi]